MSDKTDHASSADLVKELETIDVQICALEPDNPRIAELEHRYDQLISLLQSTSPSSPQEALVLLGRITSSAKLLLNRSKQVTPFEVRRFGMLVATVSTVISKYLPSQDSGD